MKKLMILGILMISCGSENQAPAPVVNQPAKKALISKWTADDGKTLEFSNRLSNKVHYTLNDGVECEAIPSIRGDFYHGEIEIIGYVSNPVLEDLYACMAEMQGTYTYDISDDETLTMIESATGNIYFVGK